MTVRGASVSGVPSRGSPSRLVVASAIHSGRSVKLTNPGPLTVGGVADAADVQVADDLCGDLARRLAQLLGERERRVGLEVRERGRPDQRVRAGVVSTERGAEGAAHPVGEDLLRICHVHSLFS